MIDGEEIGTIFDNESADLIAQIVRRVKGELRNTGVGRTFVDSGPVQWVPFYNTHATAVPPYGVVRPTTDALVLVNGINQPLMKITQPSTVFAWRYGVNDGVEVPAGGTGRCTLSGPTNILCETTLTSTQSAGPKAGQWSAAVGQPATIDILGTVSAASTIMYGTLHPIAVAICKSTGAVPKLSATTNYRAYAGTQGSETKLSTVLRNRIVFERTVANALEPDTVCCKSTVTVSAVDPIAVPINAWIATFVPVVPRTRCMYCDATVSPVTFSAKSWRSIQCSGTVLVYGMAASAAMSAFSIVPAANDTAEPKVTAP